VSFAQVGITSVRDQARPADAIIVMGAAQYQGTPSRVFAARLEHAIELYRQGLAPIVVLTGGSRTGDLSSEARAADDYLQARGVPAGALRLEVDGRSSYESIAASARFLRDEGVDDVIIVSDGWHLARSAAIARSVGLDAHPSPATDSAYSAGSAARQMLRETVGLSVGRVIGFRRLDNLSALSAP
jgi:uncharacterized SAM-binding protein YcdF (DUF218 family)